MSQGRKRGRHRMVQAKGLASRTMRPHRPIRWAALILPAACRY